MTFLLTIAEPAADAPSAPTVTPYGNSQRIDLTWTDNSNNETGFVILRSENGSSFAEIATVAGVRTFYDNTASTVYRFAEIV
ncbi:MAG: hypothetical protein H7144_00045 [Burkholderiales bacterium]|nr:hypothetical protein [Phycisphaerae bacterium]